MNRREVMDETNEDEGNKREGKKGKGDGIIKERVRKRRVRRKWIVIKNKCEGECKGKCIIIIELSGRGHLL